MAAAFAVALLLPASARADWLLSPNVGITFGGAAEGREHLTYGASIGWMGAGIFGFEGDFQFSPEFFEPNDEDLDLIDSSNVVSVMGNAIIGIPIGGQRGAGIRPFGIAGVGLLKTNQSSADEVLDVSSNDFGFNLGVGAMAFFSDHAGIRGDLRYVRSFEDVSDGFDIEAGNFDFWRANVGVTFRW